TDLNNALLSYILTGYNGYSSSAGYIGNMQIDHDISLLIPELWCRMNEDDLDPKALVKNGCLQKLDDFEHEGETILASRLGYRITDEFLHMYFGKVFDNPTAIFNEEMLKPELQDMDAYIDGIKNICESQTRVAKLYFDDGSIESACPPLKALLHIMAHGDYEGKSIDDPKIRQLFERESVINSDWYKERLSIFQTRYENLWKRHLDYLQQFKGKAHLKDIADQIDIDTKINYVQDCLKDIQTDTFKNNLIGTFGADPLYK
ncbi:MAG: hypothetical protein HRT89_12345, partial [Lentisphaeria bacterium]|nr:hypothetical protein [Lentisphaeria bacterium]NQZ68847.1 hypothetical protein [Lentisphaeria bacterium]